MTSTASTKRLKGEIFKGLQKMSCIRALNPGKVRRGWGFRGPALLLAVIMLMALVPSATVLAAPDWSYYATITINSAQVPSTQTNFPVLISLTHDSLRHTGHGGNVGRADGGDIVFTNDANTVKYDHEIERYHSDTTTGTLVAWVRIPTLSGTVDTVIRMWYGNPGAADQWNPTGVWDANFMMVQHLQENPDNPDPAFKDSTLNANHGRDLGGMTSADQVAGQIDGSIDFDGLNDYVRAPDAASLDITDAITLEAWVNLPNAGRSQKIVGKTPIGSGYLMGVDGSKLFPEIWDSRGTRYFFEAGTIPSNQWTFLVATWETGGRFKGYINGVEVADILASSSPIGTNTDPLIIGAAPWDTTHFLVAGLIDEVRISSTARSADWIATSYNNQSDQLVGGTKFIKSVVYDTAAPENPIYELPTIILMSVGLVGLGVYVWLKKRRQWVVAAS